MNDSDIQDLLSKKDEELKEKKRFTLEIFDLIKDDCVNLMIKKQIDGNFEYPQTLFGSDILEFIIKRKSYTFYKYSYEINTIHGVEKAWVRFNLLSPPDGSIYDIDFYKKLDAALLCTELRKYIISKGFKAYSYVHRFTDQRCNGLIFSITRSGLLNKDQLEKGGAQDDSDLATAVLGALILVGLIIYGIVKFYN